MSSIISYAKTMWKLWNYPINIHCWGGFGSQLYALTLARDLQNRFCSREIKFYFHTGGVTYRNPEILSLIGDFSYEVVNDFGIASIDTSTKRRFCSIPRAVIIKLVFFTGLMSRSDSDSEFRRIKPWVKTIRGHYSYRSQNETTIKKIFPVNMFDADTDFKFLGVQYRLGDLTDLESKSPIDSNRIATLIHRIDPPGYSVWVYSDTPSEATDRLSKHGIECRAAVKNSLETVIDLSQADYFVGTSSKISFWIAILRVVVLQKKDSFLPSSNINQLKLNVGLEKSSLIQAY